MMHATKTKPNPGLRQQRPTLIRRLTSPRSIKNAVGRDKVMAGAREGNWWELTDVSSEDGELMDLLARVDCKAGGMGQDEEQRTP